MSRTSARACCRFGTCLKIEILGAQDKQIFVEFSTQQLAGLGIDRAALIAALQAQNAVSPSGSIQTGDEKLLIRVSGAFRSENDILDINFLSNGRLIRLRDIAEVRRALADPPQPMFRINGKPAIGLAIAMRDGGDILALGRNVKKAVGETVADLPLGIDATLVSDQPVVVRTAIGEFMTSLWQPIAIIMAVSIVRSRLPARRGRRAVDPSDDSHRVPDHGRARNRSPAHFARRPHHRPRSARR
jgi:multidrug efflux pump